MGDDTLVASGLPRRNGIQHASEIARMAQAYMRVAALRCDSLAVGLRRVATRSRLRCAALRLACGCAALRVARFKIAIASCQAALLAFATPTLTI